MDAFTISFGIVFLAELGDKSQLAAMTFAARYRASTVLLAITLATATINLISVVVGGALGAALPTDGISVLAGVSFVVVGAWTFLGDGDDHDDRDISAGARSGRSVFATVGVTFFLAELGDKTMVATVALATDHGLVGTWLGATLAMVLAGALAIAVGRQVGAWLPERVIRIGASIVFVVFGLILIIDGLT